MKSLFKTFAVLLSVLTVAGCSSIQSEVLRDNREIIKAQTNAINKPLIDLKCPLEGCVITGLTVNNPHAASMIRTQSIPKTATERVVDGVMSALPIAGQLWLQDRNGQRGLESQRINSDLQLGIINGTMQGAGDLVGQALGAVPDAVVIDPVVVQPDVIQVPTQVIDQPTVVELPTQVIEQPVIVPSP